MAPPHVAPNELIASAWGNEVVDELAAHLASINDIYAELGTWTPYTPAIGNGWTLGGSGATAFGRYKRVADVVFFSARLIFGASPTIPGGSAVPTVTLPPITATEPANGLPLQSTVAAELVDTSAGLTFDGAGELAATVVALVARNSGAAPYVSSRYVLSAVPFTWAATDEIRVAGWYQAA